MGAGNLPMPCLTEEKPREGLWLAPDHIWVLWQRQAYLLTSCFLSHVLSPVTFPAPPDESRKTAGRIPSQKAAWRIVRPTRLTPSAPPTFQSHPQWNHLPWFSHPSCFRSPLLRLLFSFHLQPQWCFSVQVILNNSHINTPTGSKSALSPGVCLSLDCRVFIPLEAALWTYTCLLGLVWKSRVTWAKNVSSARNSPLHCPSPL